MTSFDLNYARGRGNCSHRPRYSLHLNRLCNCCFQQTVRTPAGRGSNMVQLYLKGQACFLLRVGCICRIPLPFIGGCTTGDSSDSTPSQASYVSGGVNPFSLGAVAPHRFAHYCTPCPPACLPASCLHGGFKRRWSPLFVFCNNTGPETGRITQRGWCSLLLQCQRASVPGARSGGLERPLILLSLVADSSGCRSDIGPCSVMMPQACIGSVLPDL